MIPIQNIFYLLSYAWNNLEEAETVFVADDDFESHLDLFAKVFVNGCQKLIRRGLMSEYEERTEYIRSIKGKLNLSQSLKRGTFSLGIASCSFDEFSHDTLANQILKRTCWILIRSNGIASETKYELRKVYQRMNQVSDIAINQRSFTRLRIGRNNSHYRFIIKVCRLIIDNIRLHEDSGSYEFIDFLRDEKKMAMLFESFLLHFYRKNSDFSKVKSEILHWNAEAINSTYALPQMKTDISLISEDRKIIMDAKYYKEALQSNYEKLTFKSANLYQLFAYLKNDTYRGDKPIEGMLVYPTISNSLDECFIIDGHPIKIASINLDQDWRDVERDLIDIIKD